MINLKQAVKPKRIFGLLIFSLLLTGCSDNSMEYTKQIEELEKKVQELTLKTTELLKENKELKETKSSIQSTDRTSRKIMRYITNGDFDKLKEEFNAEFELNQTKDEILFTKLENNMVFTTKLFDGPAYISDINTGELGTEIAYFIYDPPNDRDQLIYFKYDIDGKFEYIGSGH